MLPTRDHRSPARPASSARVALVTLVVASWLAVGTALPAAATSAAPATAATTQVTSPAVSPAPRPSGTGRNGAGLLVLAALLGGAYVLANRVRKRGSRD